MEKKTEKDGVLWFVNRCAGCPWLTKGSRKIPNRCEKLGVEILNTSVVRNGCPLEDRR